jgi:hypothetical protein
LSEKLALLGIVTVTGVAIGGSVVIALLLLVSDSPPPEALGVS